MQLLVLLLSFLIFLYCLYKLSGDDHVFIRKNISLEQIFDIAFSTLWISLIVSRLFYFIFHKVKDGDLFILFFTTRGGLSFIGGVIGAVVGLYLLGKYRKVPLGRVFDFFTLATLFALPIGFLGYALTGEKHAMLPQLITAFIYALITFLFIKFLYPRLMSRALKEGNISILFLIFFSLYSITMALINSGKVLSEFLTLQTASLLALFFVSLFLLIKQERGRGRSRNKTA